MDKNAPSEGIDIVYLWVDGSDPDWQKKHDEFTGRDAADRELDCKGRYTSIDELKFSLRSLELYAPWVRRVFIVTDNQVPAWLNLDHPKLRIVDHTEILPPGALPCFNSNVLEHGIFRIPGLSERFIYANDDMMLNRSVSPADFFTPEGLPVIRMNRRPMRKLTHWVEQHILGRKMSPYNITIQRTAELVKRRTGKFIGHKNHHNIDAYLRSDYARVYETFRDSIEPTLGNHLRHESDIQRNIYSYIPIIEKRCRLKFVTRKTSFRLHTHRHHHYGKMMRYNPTFFCVNDSEYATDADRAMARRFLETRFPKPSSFEKA